MHFMQKKLVRPGSLCRRVCVCLGNTKNSTMLFPFDPRSICPHRCRGDRVGHFRHTREVGIDCNATQLRRTKWTAMYLDLRRAHSGSLAYYLLEDPVCNSGKLHDRA